DEVGSGLERAGKDAVDSDLAGAAVAIHGSRSVLRRIARLFADQGSEPLSKCRFGHGARSVAKGTSEAKLIPRSAPNFKNLRFGIGDLEGMWKMAGRFASEADAGAGRRAFRKGDFPRPRIQMKSPNHCN